MQKIKDFLRFAIVALVIGLGVGYALAAWVPPGGPPTPDPGIYNTPEPINVGPTAQIKDGGFGTNAPLIRPLDLSHS